MYRFTFTWIVYTADDILASEKNQPANLLQDAMNSERKDNKGLRTDEIEGQMISCKKSQFSKTNRIKNVSII